MKKKLFFLIHDLGQGGAEKVLVNLVNNLDTEKFEITVGVLFGGGINEQFLKPEIRLLRWCPMMIPGNSKLMKLLSPRLLHRLIVKDTYDIEIAYLEGPTTRVISGCENPATKRISWLHSYKNELSQFLTSYQSEQELRKAYGSFDAHVFVSQEIMAAFSALFEDGIPKLVLYNTIESNQIQKKAEERLDLKLELQVLNLIAVGSLKPIKGYKRLLTVIKRLKDEGYSLHLTLLGIGPQEAELRAYIEKYNLSQTVVLQGYDVNPYKYIKKHDMFVCSSYSEGFSTAVTEALILGIPVLTTEVSGMKELLGENQYGCIVPNSEEGIYVGLKKVLDDPAYLEQLKHGAQLRGIEFHKEKTVKEVEALLDRI